MEDKYFKVVVVNGAPGSGKTSFEQAGIEYLGYKSCKMRSTVDKVKKIAELCGWNGEKDLKSRKFLSDLKDILTEYNDLPHRDIVDFLEDWKQQASFNGSFYHKHVLFVDSREPEDIERFKQELNATTLLIRRADAEGQSTSNHADANVFNYNYDYIINNDGTLDDLAKEVKKFIDLLFKEK